MLFCGIVSPRWATVTDEDGGVRIADAEDFVRLEVGTALRREDVTVIPVLVSGARMPDGDDLPSDLRPLTRRNARARRGERRRRDVERRGELEQRHVVARGREVGRLDDRLRDGRRRPALRPDDPGGTGARAHPGKAPL